MTLKKEANSTETLGFVNTQTARFHDGLTKAVTAGSDVFSFEVDGHDWPGVDKSGPYERLTIVILVRPKELADVMLEAIEQARSMMLAAEKAAPVEVKEGTASVS